MQSTLIDIHFFCYQQFFIFILFTHNIQNITKQNNRHILNISMSNQKGEREGRTTKTQKSLPYTISTSIKKHCQASMVKGLALPTRAVVHSHDTICRRLRIQYVFLHMLDVFYICYIFSNMFFIHIQILHTNLHTLQKSEVCLVVPSQRGSKSLSRTFSFTIPGWWNNLPTPIRNAGSLSIFKQQLKTHLFRHYLTSS